MTLSGGALFAHSDGMDSGGGSEWSSRYAGSHTRNRTRNMRRTDCTLRLARRATGAELGVPEPPGPKTLKRLQREPRAGALLYCIAEIVFGVRVFARTYVLVFRFFGNHGSFLT